MPDEVVYSKVLKERVDDFSQWRLTVTEFRGEHYLNIREYFLDFDSEWQPTRKGISIPLELTFTRELLEGLKELVSEGEQQETS
jgi:hypothetical protein